MTGIVELRPGLFAGDSCLGSVVMTDLQMRAAILDVLADIENESALVVGVSGGADSVALLRAVIDVGVPRSWQVHAVIVDHGLQQQSAATSARALAVAQSFGPASARVVSVDVGSGPGSGGPEAAARTARRAALEHVAVEVDAKAVLLGHTLDDQAETVLLGLARGSGARSLSGMREREGLWRRPLLRVSRSRVRSSVADVDVFEDPHNTDMRFARSRVRSKVLPVLQAELGASIVDALARSADMLRDDADALDALAEESTTTDVHELLLMPRAIRTRVLRNLARHAGCAANDLTREHVLGIDELLTRWHGQGALNLPGGVTCERRGGRLWFEHK